MTLAQVGCVVTLVASGCERALDQDRYKIEELRKSVQSAASIDEVSGVRPGSTLEEIIVRDITNGQEDDVRLERIAQLTESGSGLGFTLQQARQAALENNIGLQSVLVGPKVAEQFVRVQEARFESTFDVAVQATRTVMPSYNSASNQNYTIEEDVFYAQPSLTVPLRTGGSVSLDWTVGSQVSTLEDGTGVPSIGLAAAYATVAIQQPILRNAGLDFNESRIVLARANEGAVEAMTQYAVIRTLLDTETAYWNLYRAWSVLETYQDIHEYTRTVLEDSRRLANNGAGSISSVYNFEVALAKIVSLLIGSEEQVNLAVRGLKTLIQAPRLSLDTSVVITPESEPILRVYEFDPTALVDQAISNRADLLALEFQEIEAAIEVLSASNQLLPELNLMASYTFNGFDSTSSSMRTAQRDLFDNGTGGGNPQGWALGLSASVPLGNERAIGMYQAALLERLKTIANTHQREIMVSAEVLDAVDSMRSDWDQILVSRYEIAAAQRNLEVMQRLFDLGERTSTDVVVAIRMFAEARISAVDADTSYQISLARLAASIGCVLGFSGVEWETLGQIERLERLEQGEVERNAEEANQKNEPSPDLSSQPNGARSP